MKTIQIFACCFALAFSLPAQADKPAWAGGGNGKGQSQSHAPGNSGQGQGHAKGPQKAEVPLGGYFSQSQITTVRSYYGNQFRAGNCPPGLAKKNNGCMPPGQAKKWQIGHPLGDLVYYAIAAELLRSLGNPPEGHKYVRVGADILLIAIGTAIVVDAIEDIGNL